MYTVLSFDLDGTLLDGNGSVDASTFDIIRKIRALGVLVIISTGRPPRVAIDLFKDKMRPDYLVCYNGGRVYKNNQCIQEKFISNNVVLELVEYLNTIDGIMYGLEMDDQIHLNDKTVTKFSNRSNILLDKKNIRSCQKILIIGESDIDYEILTERFGGNCNIIRTDGGNLIEIMPQGITKLSALNYILKLEKAHLANVIAFGDDTNDFEIIKDVGCGVAMGNSVEILKEVATLVTTSNNENGVLNVLRMFFEKKEFASI